jgi:hypothetical protein
VVPIAARISGDAGADIGPEKNGNAGFQRQQSLLCQHDENTGGGAAALHQGGESRPMSNPSSGFSSSRIMSIKAG